MHPSTSGEIFLKRLHQALDDLENVICGADDIIVYGCADSKEDSSRGDDRKLDKLLEICQSIGVRLNKQNCQFRATSIRFCVHLVTNQGLEPDPTKIKVTVETHRPVDAEGVQRLNGTVNIWPHNYHI